MLSQFNLIQTKAESIRVGDIFGRLTVIAFGQIPGTYIYKAVCQCACGSPLKAIRFDGLKNGNVTGCGCVQRERITTHGKSQTRHYSRWQNMMDRCYNPDCKAYPDYGGRGIKVCIRWHDVATFISELPEGFFEGAEIDRIDNDGNYEPGNIQWSGRRKNAGNRRSARLLTFGDKCQSLTEWAFETGLSVGLIWERLDVLDWPVEKALTTPAMTAKERMAKAHETRWAGHQPKPKAAPRQVKRFLHEGRSVTLREMSDMTGIELNLLRKRICERGWSVEKATAAP